MTTSRRLCGVARWLAAGAGFATAAYGTYAAVAWFRYGHASPASADEPDPLLDRVMPAYDIAERFGASASVFRTETRVVTTDRSLARSSAGTGP